LSSKNNSSHFLPSRLKKTDALSRAKDKLGTEELLVRKTLDRKVLFEMKTFERNLIKQSNKKVLKVQYSTVD